MDFKTLLYIEGVAAATDAGRWEALEPDARLEAFDHALLMRTRGDLLVARLWSSADGKGRTRYPMVVVAQLSGVTIEWALGTALPELDALRARCVAATTAAEVVAAVDSARLALRARAEAGPAASAELTIPAAFPAALAADPAMGPDRRGLHRVLYQVRRELADYAIGVQPPSRLGRIEEPRAQHLRLPAPMSRGAREAGEAGNATGPGPGDAPGRGVDSAAAALLTTARLLLSKLEPATPMLLIAPLSRDFVDAIVGEPAGAQLFCLRAGERASPLTTDIPYTIDDATASDADAWIEAAARAGDVEVQFSRRAAGTGRFRALPPLLLAVAVVLGAPRPARAERTDPPGEAPTAASAALPRDRYNDALRAFARRLETPGLSDDDAAAAAREFLDTARALPGGIAFLSSVVPTLEAVQSTLTDAKDDDLPDATALGPASTGLYTGSLEGAVLRFRPRGAHAGGLPELAFVPVVATGEANGAAASRAVTYMAVTETSVGVFSAIVGFQGAAARLDRLMPRFDANTDTRDGPRAWEWGGAPNRPIVPARAWLRPRFGVRGPTYADGAAPPPPGPDSPMQFVGPGAALYAARLVGCRLPTTAEWAALRHKFTAPAPTYNRRDAVWARQEQHSHSARATSARVPSPDAGMFTPENRPPIAGNDVLDADDGFLWFAPVGMGGGAEGSPVHHVVGNVAEWAFAERQASLPQARPEAVAEYIKQSAPMLRVIGASALSPSSWSPEEAFPVNAADAVGGYADVGFRLTFSGGEVLPRALGARLLRRLTPLPLLPTR